MNDGHDIAVAVHLYRLAYLVQGLGIFAPLQTAEDGTYLPQGVPSCLIGIITVHVLLWVLEG